MNGTLTAHLLPNIVPQGTVIIYSQYNWIDLHVPVFVNVETLSNILRESLAVSVGFKIKRMNLFQSVLAFLGLQPLRVLYANGKPGEVSVPRRKIPLWRTRDVPSIRR